MTDTLSPTGQRAVRHSAIDTPWIRRPQQHRGLRAAVAGLLLDATSDRWAQFYPGRSP